MAPGELGDVDQAVDALQVHEGAEVDDVGDLALDHLAGLQAAQDLLADLLALLLQDRAAREHDVVAAAVELDHLALELGAHELVEVLDAADVDQRGGQEAAHAEVEDEAALDDLDHGALDRLAGLGGALDPAPGLLEAGALLGEDQAPFLVLLGEDERVHLLAQLDLVGGIHRLADRELVGGDDALGLEADVHQHLVLVDADDLAADHVALLEGVDRRGVVGDELAVDLDHQVGGRARAVGRSGRRLPAARTSAAPALSGASVSASVVASGAGMNAAVWQSRAPRSATVCPRAQACHKTRRRAHPALRRARRAHLRRQLRRTRGRTRAGGLGRRRPGRRPLRDRRAPDLGLRHPDRVAARAGPGGLRAAGVRHPGRAHARTAPAATGSPSPSPPSTTASSARSSGSSPTRASRPPRSRAARATSSTPTAATSPRR